MKKIAIIVIVLILVATAIAFFVNLAKKATPKSLDQTAQGVAEKIVKDKALKNALNLYTSQKQAGVDFSNGPCLGLAAPDWVADIAHNPRQPVDDLPENQCEDFRKGSASHFIELDPEGQLIRTF